MRKHYGNVVTDCTGDVTMATKVDDEMRRYVEQEADRLEVSKVEFLRLLQAEQAECLGVVRKSKISVITRICDSRTT